ncbi:MULTISPECIES: WxL protein peptidoglycan domain-containing protein [unclassified Streptomyces]|uniref:WxL protein peptidoglycan domain-containing protein n=1 Tax=unclassified Streptomyces TaxID=2593676 RepID=UPI0036E59583
MYAVASPRRTTAFLVRTAVLALFAALTLTGAFTAPARAAEGDVTWTVRTAANEYGDDRSSFSYGVNPGGEAEDTMVVANHGTTPLRLAVYAADGYTTEKGQLDLLTKEKKSRSIGSWVHTPQESVRIAPGKSAEIPFTVKVPRDATPGDYVGGILTSLKQSDNAEGIAVDRRLGIRIKLRVSGALRPALAVEDVHIGYDGSANPFAQGDATVTYSLHNTGNALLSGTQKVTLTGPFGTLSTDAGTIAASPELLPGERWKVTVPLHDVTPALRLTAAVTVTPLITDAAGSTTALEPVRATAHGWAVPWTLLLLLILVLAAAVAAFVLVRRARVRRARREEERVREAVEQALRDKADLDA